MSTVVIGMGMEAELAALSKAEKYAYLNLSSKTSIHIFQPTASLDHLKKFQRKLGRRASN